PGRPRANVVVVQHATLQEEADTVAAFIDHYLTSHPKVPPGQVLVLSPRRMMGNAVKDALIQRRRNALSYFFEDAVDSDAAAEGAVVQPRGPSRARPRQGALANAGRGYASDLARCANNRDNHARGRRDP